MDKDKIQGAHKTRGFRYGEYNEKYKNYTLGSDNRTISDDNHRACGYVKGLEAFNNNGKRLFHFCEGGTLKSFGESTVGQTYGGWTIVKDKDGYKVVDPDKLKSFFNGIIDVIDIAWSVVEITGKGLAYLGNKGLNAWDRMDARKEAAAKAEANAKTNNNKNTVLINKESENNIQEHAEKTKSEEKKNDKTIGK